MTHTAELQQVYMRLCIDEALKSPPKPTNFCVGACLVSSFPGQLAGTALVTGYTLECEDNTHAEQCCFIKLARHFRCSQAQLGEYLPEGTALYTTMEPCNKRSVGNVPCVDRVLGLRRADGKQAIGKVYVGVSEPETFVGVNEGRKKLQDAGIEVVHVLDFQEDILAIATAGHAKESA